MHSTSHSRLGLLRYMRIIDPLALTLSAAIAGVAAKYTRKHPPNDSFSSH